MTRDSFHEEVLERSRSGKPMFSPILMQFAAHRIGRTYKDFYLDHQVLVSANKYCMEEFGTDTVSLISDPFREAEAFGAQFGYPDEGVPVCLEPAIRDGQDPAVLVKPDVHQAKRTKDRIDGARALRAAVGDDGHIIGWVEGPLASACDLIDISQMLMKLVLDPSFTKKILEITLDTAIDFALAQIQAGCDIMGVGDAICSQIGVEQYRELVQPLHSKLFQAIHTAGAIVKLHICGDITHLLPALRETEVDILDLDWQVDLQSAYETLGPAVIRCGNLDPARLVEKGSPEEIATKTRELVGSERGLPFILSAGCEITPLTEPENLRAMKP